VLLPAQVFSKPHWGRLCLRHLRQNKAICIVRRSVGGRLCTITHVQRHVYRAQGLGSNGEIPQRRRSLLQGRTTCQSFVSATFASHLSREPAQTMLACLGRPWPPGMVAFIVHHLPLWVTWHPLARTSPAMLMMQVNKPRHARPTAYKS
jgi:hypothetical protein